MLKKWSICLLLASTVFLHPSAFSQPPSLINYQGRLLDGTNLVNGNVGLSLSMFNVPSGGTSIYEDSNSVTVVDGLYSTFIGDNTVSGNLETALTNANVFVEVAVNGVILSPREPVVSVAYALRAGTAIDVASSTNFALLTVPNTTVQAAGFPTVISGFIVNATVTTGGIGYLTSPAVVVNDGSGSGAGIVANIFDGAVVSLTVTNAGSGYSTNATLTIAPPGSNARQTFTTTNHFSGVNFMTNGGNVFNGTFTGSGAGLTGLSGGQLAAGSVSNAQLAANSVISTTISNGTIVNADLANNAVTGIKVSDSSLTGADIFDGSVQFQDIEPGVFWQTAGNDLAAEKEFLGSTNNFKVEFKANDRRALLLQPGAVWPSIIGGGTNTVVAALVDGAFVGNGDYHTIGSASHYSVIGGGFSNNVAENNSSATIAGGQNNDIGTNSIYSAVGGGLNNNVAANSSFATIAGGQNNDIGTNSDYSVIGGGLNNNVADNSVAATIADGQNNDIGTNSPASVIGGGLNNNVADNSPYAVIPGGRDNDVGANADNAFAAGRRAKANHRGSFVWADDTNANFASTTNNQFLIRASGGVGIGTNVTTANGLSVAGGASFGGAITAQQFSGNAAGLTNISGSSITAGSISNAALADGAVSGAKIATNAITSANVANGELLEQDFATDTQMFIGVPLSIPNPSPTSASEQFGNSVAGVGSNRFVVGAQFNDTAYLYDFNGALLATITNPAPGVNDLFGSSVTGVGSNRFVVGAPGDVGGTNVSAGSVYLYDFNGTLLATITNPAPATDDQFGFSVAGVGSNRFVVGADRDNEGADDNVGRAYLCDISGTLVATITNPAPTAQDRFGTSVAGVSSNRFVVAASRDDAGGTDNGSVYLYDFGGTLLVTITNPAPASDDQFGFSVAGVGSNRLAVGTLSTNGGSVFVYDISGTLLVSIPNPAPTPFDQFGTSIAAVGSNRFVVGAYLEDGAGATEAGSAYLYDLNGTLLATIPNPEPMPDDQFGISVAGAGSNCFVVGAKFDDRAGATDAGSAYLYRIGFVDVVTDLVADAVAPGGVTADMLASDIGVWTKSDGEIYFIGGNVGIGTSTPTNKLHVVGTVQATAYITGSDRATKENIKPVSAKDILAKVSSLPIATWNFKNDTSGQHLGPMAQDFHAAFDLGNTDSGIFTVDADGVALAAIQALAKENAELKAELEAIKQRLDRMDVK